jgi:hypothetical protein
MLFVVARPIQSPPCVVAHGHTTTTRPSQLPGTAPGEHPPQALSMPSVLMTVSRVQTPSSLSWARPTRRNTFDVQPQPTTPQFRGRLHHRPAPVRGRPGVRRRPTTDQRRQQRRPERPVHRQPRRPPGLLRLQVDQPAAWPPASPGWGPWPILAMAVTPTCFPPSRPEATCHRAKHSATGLTKAELPRRPPVQEVG